MATNSDPPRKQPEAGGSLRVRPPSDGLGSFDLANALDRFSWGNLPRSSSAAESVQASATMLQVALCCELLSRRSYHFEFGVRHPTAARMPDPAQPELNIWIFDTLMKDGAVKHYGQIRGYRRLGSIFQLWMVELCGVAPPDALTPPLLLPTESKQPRSILRPKAALSSRILNQPAYSTPWDVWRFFIGMIVSPIIVPTKDC